MFKVLINIIVISFTILTSISGIVSFVWLILLKKWEIAVLGVLLGIAGGAFVKFAIGFIGSMIGILMLKASESGRKYQAIFWVIVNNTVAFLVLSFWGIYVARFFLNRLYSTLPLVACLAILSVSVGIYSKSSLQSISEILSAFSLQFGIILGSTYILLSNDAVKYDIVPFIFTALSIGLLFTLYFGYQIIKEDIADAEPIGGFGSEMVFGFMNILSILTILWFSFSFFMACLRMLI